MKHNISLFAKSFFSKLHCFLAVVLQGIWLDFSKDQLFCLLGPNGAGKTTAINCLTGITPVTAGDGESFSFPRYLFE